MGEALTAAKKLVGLQIVAAGHAADMRGFGFRPVESQEGSPKADWWLHILCSWRLESDESIITGSFDWNEPEDAGLDTEQWDPAEGGSLQEAKLRELFVDGDRSRRSLVNNTELLVVGDAAVNGYGDLTLNLTGGFRLRVFPTGSRGEFWRIFKKDDMNSHYVCEVPAE